MFAMTRQVDVIHRWLDGPDVLTRFELRTATAGPMAIVNWSHVEDGRITRIRVTFDPRPSLADSTVVCTVQYAAWPPAPGSGQTSSRILLSALDRATRGFPTRDPRAPFP